MPVSLAKIVYELEGMGDDDLVLVNRKTGDVVTVTEQERALVEDEDAIDDLGLGPEHIEKIRAVLESKDYQVMPGRFDIDEWSIMEDFAGSLPDPSHRAEVENAIHGSGAFRYFKDTIHRLGIADDWYRFREEAIKRIAADFLEANGIPYV